jgi:hypothetical protein
MIQIKLPFSRPQPASSSQLAHAAARQPVNGRGQRLKHHASLIYVKGTHARRLRFAQLEDITVGGCVVERVIELAA